MVPTTRAMRARADASADRLPRDALSDALLRLPAREICRLRAVCRPWRALTSDPAFVRAHAAAHPGPLFVAKFRDDPAHVYVIDAGGTVLKRVAGADGGVHVLRTRLDLACLATDWNRCRVLNPATGALQVLPQSSAPQHKNRVNLSNPYTFFALGLVASTGEYKVFRMFNRLGFLLGGEQLFEVLTINDSSGAADSCWRAMPMPSLFIEASTGGVVGSVVYFFVNRGYNPVTLYSDAGARSDYILSFDLEREEWRSGLAGPIGEEIDSGEDFQSKRYRFALAELKGSLVLVYKRRQKSIFVMDLWFLMDFENGLWEKKYTLRTRVIAPTGDNLKHVIPILVLNDGRIVIHAAPTGVLIIWNKSDPRVNNFVTLVEGRPLDSVGVYTGSLLSLQ
ncbi:hypothetical protein SETIT_2G101700v2 [Setaria italica]|uniref:F-box domain-containing protein n=2 Tax=Setaria italica TaxID=4555 RepID=A0A368PXE3_SETIT|nr:putative F-box protein At5g52610 [Setaria italica]RCV10302.1 hypothetical protein SETIT_2G101700v2 [Setaria italica]